MKDGTYVIIVDEYLESKARQRALYTKFVNMKNVNSYRNTKICCRIVVFKFS